MAITYWQALQKKPRLVKARTLAMKAPLGQFGQAHASSTNDGRNACTHRSWQFVLEYILGRRYTLDQISQMAGYVSHYPDGTAKGMTAPECRQLIDKTGIPYVVKWGQSFANLARFSNRGPCLMAIRYGSWPEWRDYDYRVGSRIYHSDSQPNGYARPDQEAGRTQINPGADEVRHMTVLLGYVGVSSDRDPDAEYYECLVLEPNHCSSIRPDTNWIGVDRVRSGQAGKAFEDFAGSTYCIVPTEAITPFGGLT